MSRLTRRGEREWRRRGAFVLFAVVIFSGCGGNEGVLRAGKASPSPPAAEQGKKSAFESDLAGIKEAKFTWLYVVRRRDGGILNSEDKAFVKQHTVDANRRMLSDDGKAIIIGSNYNVTVAGAEALSERFDVTDLSAESRQP